MKIKIDKKYILFLFALLGFAVSAELSYIYWKANFLSGAAPSFCTINDVIDCDAVAKTAFARFLGVPQSVYGMFFYLLIMFLAAFPFRKFKFFKNFNNPESYIFSLSTLAVIGSLILWVISTFVIQKVCLLCYILYGVNILLLVVSKFGKPVLERYKDSFRDFAAIVSDTRWLMIEIAFVILAVSLIAAADITKVFIPPQENVMEQGGYEPHGNILGDPHPKIIINEYTDFQCPYCAMSNLMMYRLVNEVPGVMVVHHDFPLNKQCNPIMKVSPHKYSCEAALYALAAKKQGKYWDYITLLFENQQDLSEPKLISFGKKLNLDTDKLQRDAHSPEVKEELSQELENAAYLQVKATPTYFIGIKRYEGLMPYPELRDTVVRAMYN